MIKIITIPTSTTNIHIHYFKTTFHILNTLQIPYQTISDPDFKQPQLNGYMHLT